MANSLLTCDKSSLSTQKGSPSRSPSTGLSLPRDHLERPHRVPSRSRRAPHSWLGAGPHRCPNPPIPPRRVLPRRCPHCPLGRGSRPAAGTARPAALPERPLCRRTCSRSPAGRRPPRCPARGLSAGLGWRSRPAAPALAAAPGCIASAEPPGSGQGSARPRPGLPPPGKRQAASPRRELALSPGARAAVPPRRPGPPLPLDLRTMFSRKVF